MDERGPGVGERPSAPVGFLHPEALDGSTPFPGWVCAQCGAIVGMLATHAAWHERGGAS
jgi:hypothetical protein